MATRLTGSNNFLNHYLLRNSEAITREMAQRHIHPECLSCLTAQLLAGRKIEEEQQALAAQRADTSGVVEDVLGDLDEPTQRQIVDIVVNEIKLGPMHAQIAEAMEGFEDALAEDCMGPVPAGSSEITSHLPPERLVCPYGFLLRQAGIPNPDEF